MKIYYSPTFGSQCYIDLGEKNIRFDSQCLDTQGLVSQLALHAGIHQDIPSYSVRLVDYFHAVKEYDESNPDNMFHKSFAIDGMSVAKSLLQWRDTLSLGGWDSDVTCDGAKRLAELAKIEKIYEGKDCGLSVLLAKLQGVLEQMKQGDVAVPHCYKELEIVIPCAFDLLPDYIKPILDAVKALGGMVTEDIALDSNKPASVKLVQFSQQWKAEAWMSQQAATDYDVWINSDSKRLDNWLHMTNHPVAGSKMLQSNPQITQLFLLAIQLFQRPLNVNVLLQYLLLPECPLNWKLRTRLAQIIVREGGFCNVKVMECIDSFVESEFIETGDASTMEKVKEERQKNVACYLPFDLTDAGASVCLAGDDDDVDLKKLSSFIEGIKDYASSRAINIMAMSPDDARILQLRMVAELCGALLSMTDTTGSMPFNTLQQWGQSLYDNTDYNQYHSQIGSQMVINSPMNLVSAVKNCIWCDFYGDESFGLSTDFLSPLEQKILVEAGVRIWKAENEKEFYHMMMMRPVRLVKDNLVLVACTHQGASKLAKHPLSLQIEGIDTIDGDAEFEKMPQKEVSDVDNCREEDKIEVLFDAKSHPVSLRETESFSSLETILQNPLDYFMHYILEFSETSATEIKLSVVYGNVAHETIENLFTTEKDTAKLKSHIDANYEEAFNTALISKGALLLLPEHHMDRDRLKFQLRRCVDNLADIIIENRLQVVTCEQKEEQDLDFDNKIIMVGYIDMLLKDEAGKDVVIDLKWTTKKDKHKNLLEKNREAQLAIYQAMLKKHEGNTGDARTAFYVMPLGKLLTKDVFSGKYVETIDSLGVDIMAQLRKGYETRLDEFKGGYIETSDNMSVKEIKYSQTSGVFPLADDGKKRDPKKEENKYSDYKCFTI